MPIGPNDEKHLVNVIAKAVHIMSTATNEAEKAYIDSGKRKGGMTVSSR